MKRTSLLALTVAAGAVAATAYALTGSPAPAVADLDAGCADAGATLASATVDGVALSALAVEFAGGSMVLAPEQLTGERPSTQLAAVAAPAGTSAGAGVTVTDRAGAAASTLAAVVDAKGDDRLVVSSDAGVSWSVVATGPDIAYPAVSPSGDRVAWSANGVLTTAAAADGWEPAAVATASGVTGAAAASAEPGKAYAMHVRFVDETTLVLSVEVDVEGVDPEDAALADVWTHDLATGAWTRLTSGKADADAWSIATTPLLQADGTLLYVRMSGLASGTDADLRTELRRVRAAGTAKAGADEFVAQLPHRWGLLAVDADGSTLWNAPDTDSRWQVVRRDAAGSTTPLGCGRASWAPALNHDPDRS